jgi:hypothetical protein
MSRILFDPTFPAQLNPREVQGTFTRGIEFNQTVTVSIEQSAGETFTFQEILDVTRVGESNDPVTITISGNTIEFDGTYFQPWEDLFTFVPPGESNKKVDPQIVVGIPNVPSGQDLYDLDQDQRHFVFNEYDVTVKYISDLTSEEITETETLTHEVFNDLEAIRSFMANYDYGEGQ